MFKVFFSNATNAVYVLIASLTSHGHLSKPGPAEEFCGLFCLSVRCFHWSVCEQMSDCPQKHRSKMWILIEIEPSTQVCKNRKIHMKAQVSLKK